MKLDLSAGALRLPHPTWAATPINPSDCIRIHRKMPTAYVCNALPKSSPLLYCEGTVWLTPNPTGLSTGELFYLLVWLYPLSHCFVLGNLGAVFCAFFLYSGRMVCRGRGNAQERRTAPPMHRQSRDTTDTRCPNATPKVFLATNVIRGAPTKSARIDLETK